MSIRSNSSDFSKLSSEFSTFFGKVMLWSNISLWLDSLIFCSVVDLLSLSIRSISSDFSSWSSDFSTSFGKVMFWSNISLCKVFTFSFTLRENSWGFSSTFSIALRIWYSNSRLQSSFDSFKVWTNLSSHWPCSPLTSKCVYTFRLSGMSSNVALIRRGIIRAPPEAFGILFCNAIPRSCWHHSLVLNAGVIIIAMCFDLLIQFEICSCICLPIPDYCSW